MGPSSTTCSLRSAAPSYGGPCHYPARPHPKCTLPKLLILQYSYYNPSNQLTPTSLVQLNFKNHGCCGIGSYVQAKTHNKIHKANLQGWQTQLPHTKPPHATEVDTYNRGVLWIVRVSILMRYGPPRKCMHESSQLYPALPE